MAPALKETKQKLRQKTAAAEYIAVEASRLARMAGANRLTLLAYLIDMAVPEAWREASEGDADPSVGAADPGDLTPESHTA